MGYMKQKLVWIGAVVVIVVIMVFGLAMMGSVLGAKPSHLPVGLVVKDEGAALGNGTKLNVGETVKSKLLELQGLPVDWKLAGSEEEAKKGLDDQQYYGVLVLPGDLTAGVLSLQTPAPKPATVRIIVNEGMNSQAATAVKQVLGQVMKGIGLELSKQMLAMAGQQTKQLPVSAVEALLAPIKVVEEAVHPVGANNGNGNAPNMLTQIMWMGSMIASIFLFLAAQKARAGGSARWTVASLQGVVGIAVIAAASGFTVWMASSWYGMEIQDSASVWLFLWLAGSAFVLLQSAMLNLIGFPAMGLLILLLFFSMPVIGMAPEFLPEATHNLLYSWTPFRFVTQGMRSVMYFHGGTSAASESYSALGWMSGVSLVAMIVAAGFRKTSASISDAASDSASVPVQGQDG